MNSVFLLVNLADFLHQEETNQSREEGTYQAEIEFQRKGHFYSWNPTLMIASSYGHSLSIEEEEMLAVRSSDPGLAGLVPLSSLSV